MEDGLRTLEELSAGVKQKVLILVVMEDGLRVDGSKTQVIQSLNPCCCGRWSQS